MGSRKDARETILTALEQNCNHSGLRNRRSNIPSVEKSNGKPGLVVKDAQLGGFRDLVVDVVCMHEFGGNHLADVSLNGQLRDHDPSRLLENEARKKGRALPPRGMALPMPSCSVRCLAGFMGSSCATSTSLPTAGVVLR